MTLFEEKVFLSTPSARRATPHPEEATCNFLKFNPPPSAWRPTADEAHTANIFVFSTHARRVAGDGAQA